ncbi:MAG TPA: ROK family protein [Rectinemataceae bacterium]
MRAKSRGLLALDAGGTAIKLGLVPLSDSVREVLDSEQMPMPSAGTAREIEEAFAAATSRGLELARLRGLEMVGVGVSTPEPFDFEAGVSLMKHKYASIFGLSVRDFITKAAGPLPVRFIHDAFAFLLGELALGLGAGARRPCIATLGTGLGFAGVVEGKLLKSPRGGPAADVYRSPYRDGIAEDYASARAIARRYSDLGGAGAPSVKMMAERAAAGDTLCARVFEDTGSALAEILLPQIEKNGFDLLILGGQIAKSGELLAAPTRRRLAELGSLCRVAIALRIDEAPILGAATAFFES